MTHPRVLLRLGGSLVAAAMAAYFLLDYSVLLFVALVLVPALSMAGYLVGSRWGARTDSAVHTYVGPAALGVVGWYSASTGLLAISPLASWRPLPSVGASLDSG